MGHVIRMKGSRLIKHVLVGKPGGRRQTGRQKLRWLENVEKGLKGVECGEVEKESGE